MTYDPHDTGPNDSDADKEVNLQSATFTEQAMLDAEPFQIWVDNSAGDDSNVGLTSSEALATLDEAFDRIPRIAAVLSDAYANGGVEIFLREGQTHALSGRRFVRYPWLTIKIQSASGSQLSTIQSDASQRALDVYDSQLIFQDVRIEPSDVSDPYDHAIMAHNSHVYVVGDSEIVPGADSAMDMVQGGESLFQTGANTIVDGDFIDATPTGGIISYGGGFAAVESTIRNVQIAQWTDRCSALISNAIVESSCDIGILAQDGSAGKAASNAVISASTAYDPDYGGEIQDAGADTSGATNLLPTSFYGSFFDIPNDRFIREGVELVGTRTYTLTSGQSLNSGTLDKTEPGAAVWAHAVPANDPGNSFQPEATMLLATGESKLRFQVQDLADDGGGDARIFVYRDWSQ